MKRNPLTPDQFGDLSDFVRCATGLYFDASKKFILNISVNERMQVLSMEEPAMYIEILKSKSSELEELITLLSVPETYFFRDKKQFEALRDKILPHLIAQKNTLGPGRPKIKILSCGCSSGEEPYSIAIAILQTGFIYQADIEIIAFDISKKSVEKARRAEYTKNSFREEDTGFLDTYFDVKGDRFILQDRVRELVQFYQINIFDKGEMGLIFKDVDIIFFRNVYIYFTREDVQSAINIVAKKLSSEGYLFLGFSESLFEVDKRFEVEEINNAYVWRRKGKARNKVSFKEFFPQPYLGTPAIASTSLRSQSSGQSVGTDTADKKRAERKEKISAKSLPAGRHGLPPGQAGALTESHYEDALSYAMIKMYDKAEGAFKEQLKIMPGHAGSLLGLARIYADSGQDDLAISTCRRAIAIDNLLSESYFILGLVFYKRKEFREAVSNFKKAVYSDEGHFTAQFYLGQTYLEMGERGKANRQFRVTLEVIEKLGPDALSQEVSGCSGSYIMSLCIDNIR